MIFNVMTYKKIFVPTNFIVSFQTIWQMFIEQVTRTKKIEISICKVFFSVCELVRSVISIQSQNPA